MKTVLSLLALSFLSTACGAVETDGEGNFRLKEHQTPAKQKAEPVCSEKAKPTVVVFNIVGTSDEETNGCEKEVSK